jgi:hypothetical protein
MNEGKELHEWAINVIRLDNICHTILPLSGCVHTFVPIPL